MASASTGDSRQNESKIISTRLGFSSGAMPMTTFVSAVPYPWPFDGKLQRENTALVIIDMQTDFCGKGGYIDLLGYDLSASRACIEPIGRVLATFRKLGYTVFHTREGHRPDLADLPDNKRWRSRRAPSGVGIGDAGPCG